MLTLLLASCAAPDATQVAPSWFTVELDACEDAYAEWEPPTPYPPIVMVRRLIDDRASWMGTIATNEDGEVLVPCETEDDVITVTYATLPSEEDE